MKISPQTLLRGALGIAISVVSIYVVLGSVDVGKAADVLRVAIPAWIGVMFIAVLVDVASRAARWRVLLAPIAVVPYGRVLGYTYQGYLANNILPARLGELVRTHALGEGEGLSRTTVLGTVAVERIVDTVMVVAIAAVSVLVLGVRGFITSAVLLGAAFVTLLCIGLALGVVAHRLPGAERVTRFIERWPKIIELGRRLQDGLSVASRPRTMTGAVILSLAAWTASTVTFLAGGQAVGIELTVAQGALIGSGVALASIVPSGPGYVGTFELTAVAIADALGIDRDAAFAMAILIHAMILLVTSIGGVVAIVALRRRGAAAAAAAAEADATAAAEPTAVTEPAGTGEAPGIDEPPA